MLLQWKLSITEFTTFEKKIEGAGFNEVGVQLQANVLKQYKGVDFGVLICSIT
jgi:hypothetical protein